MKVLILKGLPASGKSTFAKELLAKEPGIWKRINKDLLRELLDNGEFSSKNEEFVSSIQESILRSALRKGYNIVYDNCSLSSYIWNRLCEICESIGDITVEEKTFVVDVEECIKRDSLREGKAKVGEQVIRDMYKRYNLKKGYPESKSVYFPKKEVNSSV